MACSKEKGTSVPMAAAVWRSLFSSDGKRSIRAASTACTVAGTCRLSRGLTRRWAPGLPDQHPGLHQGAHALLQKEGIALGPCDQELLEGRRGWGRCQAEPARVPRRSPAAAGRAGVACSRSYSPAVLVFRAIVDQEQDPGCRQALNEAVEQRLGLGIDPMQILEDQHERLCLAFAQEHPLERVECALPPLWRIEFLEWAVLREGVQQ